MKISESKSIIMPWNDYYPKKCFLFCFSSVIHYQGTTYFKKIEGISISKSAVDNSLRERLGGRSWSSGNSESPWSSKRSGRSSGLGRSWSLRRFGRLGRYVMSTWSGRSGWARRSGTLASAF